MSKFLNMIFYVSILTILSCTNTKRDTLRDIASLDNSKPKKLYIDEPTVNSPLKNNTIRAVLGGKEADDNLSSKSVFLNMEGSSCSGTVIAKDTILTAAHCIRDKTKKIEIYFNNFKESLVSTKFSRFIPYPEKDESKKDLKKGDQDDHLDFDFDTYKNFQSYFDSLSEFEDIPARSMLDHLGSYDLALVFLDEELPSEVNIADFYSGNLAFRQELIGVGYGLTSRSMRERTSYNLRYTKMTLFGGYFIDDVLLSVRVHSGHYSKNVCYGDSGGGLWSRDKNGNDTLVGVLSAVYNNCANSVQSTLIHPLFWWIDKEILKHRSKVSL